ALGVARAEHPLLGAAVALAGSDGYVLTSRLSLSSHPWLADHAVLGAAVLPGTAFVELALRAGDQVGCDRLDRLTPHAPLALPPDAAVHLQLTIGEPDGTGRRAIAVYSAPAPDAAPAGWTRHASGFLATGDGDGLGPVTGGASAEPGQW